MKCKNCNSTNVFGVSRVVGYYSIIENWNGSKIAEFGDRQKGSYKLNEVIYEDGYAIPDKGISVKLSQKGEEREA